MCLVSCLSRGMAFAKMTGITDVSSLRWASTMVPDWTSHRAPTAKHKGCSDGPVDTDLVVFVGNKCSGFVTLPLVSGFFTELAQY